MKLWNYGLQHPPGKGCSTPLVEGAAPPSRGSSTPWQRVQHPLALILAPSEVLDFAKLLMYLSSQVHLWSSVLWMLEEYYNLNFGRNNLDLCQTASPEERSKFYQDCLYPRLLVSQLVSVVLFNKEGET